MALPVIAAIGVGLQAASLVKQGIDRAAISDMDAKIKNQQADQIMRVNDRQQEIYKYQAQKILGGQAQEIANSGLEVSGSPLLAMEETQHQIKLQAQATQQSAEFNANQLRLGGEISQMYGADYAASGILNGMSSLLTGGAKAYSLSDSPGGSGVPYNSGTWGPIKIGGL